MIIGDKFRKALIRLILGTVPAQITGTVKSVDEGLYTCVVTPTDGGPDYEKVRLKVSINDDDNGLVTIPDVDSLVIISPLFNNEHAYYVARYSKVKKWILKTVSGTFLEFTDDSKIKINGDEFGGLVKIEPLVEKLNNLEDLVNDLVDKYNSHTHDVTVTSSCTAGGATATGSAVATDATESTVLTATERDELENESTLHGEGL